MGRLKILEDGVNEGPGGADGRQVDGGRAADELAVMAVRVDGPVAAWLGGDGGARGSTGQLAATGDGADPSEELAVAETLLAGVEAFVAVRIRAVAAQPATAAVVAGLARRLAAGGRGSQGVVFFVASHRVSGGEKQGGRGVLVRGDATTRNRGTIATPRILYFHPLLLATYRALSAVGEA